MVGATLSYHNRIYIKLIVLILSCGCHNAEYVQHRSVSHELDYGVRASNYVALHYRRLLVVERYYCEWLMVVLHAVAGG